MTILEVTMTPPPSLPEAADHRRDIPLTARVQLNLATPRAIQAALLLLGFQWELSTDVEHDVSHGLYTWVAGPQPNIFERAILYPGMAKSESGLQGRLGDERVWMGPTYSHGHALAMNRTTASPVGGRVAYEPTDLTWLDEILSHRPEKVQLVRNWLSWSVRGRFAPGSWPALEAAGWYHPAVFAESIAVRLCIHLGDTGPPVSSQFASAWCVDAWYEWAAEAAAVRLRAEHEGQGLVGRARPNEQAGGHEHLPQAPEWVEGTPPDATAEVRPRSTEPGPRP